MVDTLLLQKFQAKDVGQSGHIQPADALAILNQMPVPLLPELSPIFAQRMAGKRIRLGELQALHYFNSHQPAVFQAILGFIIEKQTFIQDFIKKYNQAQPEVEQKKIAFKASIGSLKPQSQVQLDVSFKDLSCFKESLSRLGLTQDQPFICLSLVGLSNPQYYCEMLTGCIQNVKTMLSSISPQFSSMIQGVQVQASVLDNTFSLLIRSELLSALCGLLQNDLEFSAKVEAKFESVCSLNSSKDLVNLGKGQSISLQIQARGASLASMMKALAKNVQEQIEQGNESILPVWLIYSLMSLEGEVRLTEMPAWGKEIPAGFMQLKQNVVGQAQAMDPALGELMGGILSEKVSRLELNLYLRQFGIRLVAKQI